jgi:large subunit ribosomal protein L19
VEFLYELYDPKIQKIEVLRLEKRLDSELLYLRDAEPEFSTFSFDMEPTYLVEGEPVPVNPLKVLK